MNYEQLFYQYYHRYPESDVELRIFIEWYRSKQCLPPVRQKSSSTWIVVLALAILAWFLLSDAGILSSNNTIQAVPQVEATAALFIVTNTPKAERPATAVPIIITATPQPQADTPAVQSHCQLGADLQPIGDCP